MAKAKPPATKRTDPQAKKPDTECSFYKDQIHVWEMLSTLLSGTAAMRKAGRKYLPKYPAEAADGYEIRLTASTLLNYFKRTVTGLVGKPFSQAIKVDDSMPTEMEDLLENIDMQGSDLDTFARNAFRAGLAKGMVHFLVDYPEADENVRTLEDQRAKGARPYIVVIPPENVIAAFSEYVDGVETLTHVRIKETCVEREGFAEVTIERIRVLEPGTWQLWKKMPGTQEARYELEDEGVTTLDYIPMVTWYGEREGFMRTRPPLLDLAYLNVAHWQSASDQRNVLSVSRFPILYAAGVDPETKLEIGPNSYFAMRDTAAHMGYVEHTGAAIGAGRQDLEDLKTEMAMMGLQLLMPQQSGNQTATAKALDGAEANCGLQAMVLDFAASLNEALEVLAEWQGVEEDLPPVVINSDFGMTMDNASDLSVLMQARANREISHEAFMKELMRRQIMGPEYSIEDDQELIQAEQALVPDEGPQGAGLPKKRKASAGPDTQTQEDQASADDPVADQFPSTSLTG